MLLEFDRFMVLFICSIYEGLRVGRDAVDFAITRSKWFSWTLVRLWQFSIHRVRQLVTAVVDKSSRDIILSFTLRSSTPNITFAIFAHSTDHSSAFRVDHVRSIGGDKGARGLIGYLQLTSFVV